MHALTFICVCIHVCWLMKLLKMDTGFYKLAPQDEDNHGIIFCYRLQKKLKSSLLSFVFNAKTVFSLLDLI